MENVYQMITGKNQIGNQLKAEGTIQFRTFNPMLNVENDSVFTEATDGEIVEALALAHTCFGEFRSMSGQQKGAFLDAIADEILTLDSELIQTYMNESGLPEERARVERSRTIFQLRSFAELVREGSWVEARIDTAIVDRLPTPKSDLRKMNIGIGPIVVFGASNFPLAYSTAGGDTASALAAGCPVIVKSHPMHAGTSELVASAIIKAAERTGMPNGVFSNLNSQGIEVGTKLVAHPIVKGVGFTGSIRGGRALYDLAATRKEPIPVFAEMGSINPVVLMPSYLANNIDSLAAMLARSISLGAGQFCTNPGLIIGVKSAELSAFIAALGREISAIRPSCMLHPTIASNFEHGKEMMLNQADLVVVHASSVDLAPNFVHQLIACIDGKSFLSNPKLHEEVFGPYSLVVQCENLEELTHIIEQLEGQLTGTIFSEMDEMNAHPQLMRALQDRVGRLIFNGVPTGVEVCPSMLHGGPFPASTDSRFTAVGTDSIKRWVRTISYQNWPNDLLPNELKNENPLRISRKVNTVEMRESITFI